MKTIFSTLLLLGLASTAPAAVLYHFTLEPVLMQHSIQSTEFSVVTPDYLKIGPFTPQPFSLTLGSWGWMTPNQPSRTVEMTQGYVGISGTFFCFSFASAESTVGPCGMLPAPETLSLAGGFFGTLPTAPGNFYAAAPVLYQGLSREVVSIRLNVTEISEVPEPGTAALMGIAVATSFLLTPLRRRTSTRLSHKEPFHA